MKVLQTIQGLSASSGGPSTCTRDLLEGLGDLGASVHLLTTESADSKEPNLGKGSDWLIEVTNDYKTPLAFSANLQHALAESDYDIYHTNG